MSYLNNTNTDVRDFHKQIVAAMKNDGKFEEDIADIFTLTKTPPNSAVDYILNWF